MIEKEDDFGFTLKSEEEIREYERLLQDQIEQEQLAKLTEQQKLEQLRSMFMPLLKNLLRDPDKAYIYWPNRVEKIEKFIQKIDTFVGSK